MGIWLIVSTSLNTVIFWWNPKARAALGMVWGVIICWILICGSLMYYFREPIRKIVLKIGLPWQIKFVLFVTLLALLEEIITTGMTNLAPFLGVKIGEVYITASTNFFDVIFFHSVIAFIGPFIFWMLALKRYDFSPFSVFLIWGISGTLAEVSLGGIQHFLEFGFWIFVYGLMIFLPTYSLPLAEERKARQPKFFHYILMIFLPFIFVPLFVWIPKVIDRGHPQPSHFPPMEPLK
jgi:hypothetical protein